MRAAGDRYRPAAAGQHCASVSAACEGRHHHLGAEASSWDPSFRQHNQRLGAAAGEQEVPRCASLSAVLPWRSAGERPLSTGVVGSAEPRWVLTQDSEDG